MKIILASLILCSAAFAQERVIVIKDSNVSGVQALLNQGWMVKHQSAAQHVEQKGFSADARYDLKPLLVFTLTPPAGYAEMPEAVGLPQNKPLEETYFQKEMAKRIKAKQEAKQ